MTEHSEQLALNFRWNHAADFAGFVADDNEQVIAALRTLPAVQSESMYLAGPAGSGKSHLLQAACSQVSANGGTAVYIPLAQHIHGAAEQLDGLEALTLVAIGDLNELAGNARWQESLFYCYNRIRDRGGRLLVAARSAPPALGLDLDDLTSRLQALLRWRLSPPDDARRRKILAHLVARRGLDLPDRSANYLLRYQARDSTNLLSVVERLDQASLQTGRRLTVPFIKQVLSD